MRSINYRKLIMSVTNSAVAVFHTHAKAEEAVRGLQRSGFDMKKLSIVGKDYHTDEHVVGYYNAGDRMMYWGKAGALWGGFWSLRFGSAFFAIPGLGSSRCSIGSGAQKMSQLCRQNYRFRGLREKEQSQMTRSGSSNFCVASSNLHPYLFTC